MTMIAPELDERALEEVAPPCGCRKDPHNPTSGQCDRTATWFTISKCCGHVILHCDPHHQFFIDWFLVPSHGIRCGACDAHTGSWASAGRL